MKLVSIVYLRCCYSRGGGQARTMPTSSPRHVLQKRLAMWMCLMYCGEHHQVLNPAVGHLPCPHRLGLSRSKDETSSEQTATIPTSSPWHVLQKRLAIWVYLMYFGEHHQVLNPAVGHLHCPRRLGSSWSKLSSGFLSLSKTPAHHPHLSSGSKTFLSLPPPNMGWSPRFFLWLPSVRHLQGRRSKFKLKTRGNFFQVSFSLQLISFQASRAKES